MNNEIPTLPELRQWFIDSLADTFGKEILDIIPAPDDYEVGERVLFKLKDSVRVERKEITQKDADDFRQMIENTIGIDGAQVTTEPPVTSGLPYPRMVDIRDWDVAMEIPAKEYLASDALLPKEDFSILWLLGVVIWPSRKQLVYIDFMHPKVKTVFSACYDQEYDFNHRNDVYPHMQRFIAERNALIAETEADPNVLWLKHVQIDGQVFVNKNSNHQI